MSETRALVRVVLLPDWRKQTTDVQPAEIDAAIADIEHQALALKVVEPGFNGEASKALAKAIQPLGAMIAPTMTREQGDAFRAGIVLALSDLPPRAALLGLKRAVHVPMEFPNQVHGVARKLAEEAIQQQRTALHRLKMMKAEIERALNPQPKLEAPPMEWTQASIDEANASFERAGIKTRYRLEGTEAVTVLATPDEREAERQRNLAENGGN